MRLKNCILTLSMLLCVLCAAAQGGGLRVVVVDAVSREAVIGAVASLRGSDAKSEPRHAASNVNGVVLFTPLLRGTYDLTVTSLGYDSLRTRLALPSMRTDTLLLHPRSEAIDQVVVEVPALRSSVHGDTLSYRASAYKVAFGSDAGALLGKMPGMEIADGGIEAQGRTVQRVYVDGREFFGNDIMSAVRNIPADMIESIDVYTGQSDQSEFTGVDNGEGITTLNIVTVPDKRKGAFGRIYGAYGIEDKYIGGGNVNIFDNDRRISVVGLANNVSRQNFSFEDILGTTEGQNDKSKNNNFMVRPLDGLSTVQAVGLNYSDALGKNQRFKIAASYFFNRTDNHNIAQSEKQTFTSSDKLVLNDERNDSRTLNRNHRFTSRIDYRINDRHSMMMRTSLSAQDNLQRGEALMLTQNKFAGDDLRFVNRRRNFFHNDNAGVNFSNTLTYRYRLPGKVSHSLIFGAGGGYRSNDYYNYPRYYTFRNPDDIECDTMRADSRSISRSDRDQPGYDVNGSAAYSRQLSKRSRLNVEYRVNFTENRVDRSTYLFDNKTGEFLIERDPRQSTDYDYNYLTHRAGASYQYTFRKTKLSASAYYQHVDFASDYAFPFQNRSRSSFDNVTYNVVGTINLKPNNLLKINAYGRTANPRATDLQQIVNTINRQSVFAGNPDLQPVYTHLLSAQYIRANPTKGRTFTLSAEFSASPNSITDSLVVDTPDFIIPDGQGTLLGEGNQFLKPVNMGGFWRVVSAVNYGMPVRWLRSNLNLRAGYTVSRLPSIINGQSNYLSNDVFTGGLTLGSNISESIDFRLSYTANYNRSRSTSNVRSLDNTYFSQYAKGEVTVVVFKRLVLRANADYNYYRGITDTFLEQRLICNAMIGCKMLRNLAELSVGVNDFLDQNGTSFRRTVSGTTIRSVVNQAVGRYVSIQFTYNLRLFRRQSNAVLDQLRKTQ